MQRDISDQVAGYSGLVESLASRIARTSRARQVGVEFDDLYQEGLLNVWQTLLRGVTPSAQLIEARMRDWIRYVGGQIGRGQGADYGAMLPLEDLRDVAPRG